MEQTPDQANQQQIMEAWIRKYARTRNWELVRRLFLDLGRMMEEGEV